MSAPPIPCEHAAGPAAPEALFLHSSAGGGHVQASRALSAAWREACPGWRQQAIDYLDFLPRWERRLWLGLHRQLLRRCPALWGLFFRWLDRPNEPRLIRERVSATGAEAFAALLRAARPRLVVSTSGGAAALAGAARARLGGAIPHFVNALLVTDLRAHRHWARPEADLVFVATEEARADLARHGVPADRIQVTGIPLRPGLSALPPAERAALRARLGLSHRPAVLVSSGGTGLFWQLPTVLEALAGTGVALDVVTCQGEPAPPRQIGALRLLRLGDRPDYGDWLAAADLVVGKAGGMTVMEALAAGVPMVIYAPIPGQEEGNAALLEGAGAARWPRNPAALSAALRRLLAEGGEVERAHMAQAALRLARPGATARVVRALAGACGVDLATPRAGRVGRP